MALGTFWFSFCSSNHIISTFMMLLLIRDPQSLNLPREGRSGSSKTPCGSVHSALFISEANETCSHRRSESLCRPHFAPTIGSPCHFSLSLGCHLPLLPSTATPLSIYHQASCVWILQIALQMLVKASAPKRAPPWLPISCLTFQRERRHIECVAPHL